MDDADWLHDEELTSPPWGEAGRVATLGVVSAFSKLLLNGLNRTEVRNRAVLDKHIMQREPGVGLLTVCNHTRRVHLQYPPTPLALYRSR